MAQQLSQRQIIANPYNEHRNVSCFSLQHPLHHDELHQFILAVSLIIDLFHEFVGFFLFHSLRSRPSHSQKFPTGHNSIPGRNGRRRILLRGISETTAG